MSYRHVSSAFCLSAVCAVAILAVTAPGAVAGDWPQWRGVDRDGVWAETGLVEKFAGAELEAKWRAPVSNGYSGPTVANGRVYLTDKVTEPVVGERVLCFDAETGENIWTDTYECKYARIGYPDGPRASVTIHDGLAYTLGAMGHLRCLDAATGELRWKKDPGTDYDVRTPIWGIASAPLIEKDLVIVQLGARPGACIVALDKKTGEERWRALEDKASYSAPEVFELAGKHTLVCWTGDNAVGLNPENGEVYWKYPTPPVQMIMNIPSPVVQGDRLFLTAYFDGAYMLRIKKDMSVETIWRRHGNPKRVTDALHSTIGTPILDGDYIYGIGSRGELRCLKADTGDRVWENTTLVPQKDWATFHMVRNGGRVFLSNEAGELIIGKLAPEGFEVISRAKLIEPTTGQHKRGVCWSHPAYANKHVFMRNDNELVCASLAAE